jgi:hypothetical protein
MISQNQSASGFLPPATTYRDLTAVPSNVTHTTASPSASAIKESDGGSAHHVNRSLTSIMGQNHVSEYCIRCSKTGNYDFDKSPSNLGANYAWGKAHDQAMSELVANLNAETELDYGEPERDVRLMVERYNTKNGKIQFTRHNEKKWSESGPAWSASMSVVSENVAHRRAKEVVDKISTTVEEAASVLAALRKPNGYKRL